MSRIFGLAAAIFLLLPLGTAWPQAELRIDDLVERAFAADPD